MACPGVLVVTLTLGTLLGAVLQPFLPGFGVALAVGWGGASLLHSVWPAEIVATWIGSGMANTPAKRRHSRLRPALPKDPAVTVSP